MKSCFMLKISLTPFKKEEKGVDILQKIFETSSKALASHSILQNYVLIADLKERYYLFQLPFLYSYCWVKPWLIQPLTQLQTSS